MGEQVNAVPTRFRQNPMPQEMSQGEAPAGLGDARSPSRSAAVPTGTHTLSALLHRGAVAAITAGLVVGIVTVILSSSFAALIFSGPLSAHLPFGISMGLLTAAIVGPIVALMSSWPGMVAIPQDRTAPILALLN